MNTFQSMPANSNKSLRLLGWVLGILLILKSLDFFLSINLTAESEISPVILETILFAISGVAMLLLALGTIRLARWVQLPLYLVFFSNFLYITYSTLLMPNWMDASISLIGAVVLFFYLKKSRDVATGRRLFGLQIITILTLLPATILLLLSVVFTDQTLQDDSTMRLERYPFLKTTILSIIPLIIQTICQRKAIVLPKRLRKKSLTKSNTKGLVSPMLVHSMA